MKYLGWRAIVLDADERRVKIEDVASPYDGFIAVAAPEHLEEAEDGTDV